MTAPPRDRDLLERVYDQLRRRRPSAAVRRTTVGERLVAVEAGGPSGSHVGVAHRPPGDAEVAVPDDALALARWAFDPPASGDPVDVALGLAAMNALSAPLVPWRRGDPMAALAGDVDRVATVGLFRPAFHKFDAVDVRVVERAPVGEVEAPAGVDVSVYPPADHEAAIEGVDVLFVTGSSLVYGGARGYLRAATDVPTVALIGATASFLPGPAFDAGATIVAGARVTDPSGVWAGIEAGLCGTDLHDRGLEKVYVAADPAPAGLDLDAAGAAVRAGRD